jgi:hypothetical protein
LDGSGGLQIGKNFYYLCHAVQTLFFFLSIAVLELQISTWLNIFKLKNVKNNVAHWPSVVKVYNSSTPKDRRRASKQLKPHWQNINNKKIAHFYDYWCEWRQNIPIMSTVPKCS